MSRRVPLPPGAPLTLARFLPYRLSVASAAVSEWRVVATVGEFGSITAKAIGLHAQMSKVKVSRAAAALEARGLIARAPNPEDRREAFLVLTPAGAAVYAEIAPLALDYAARLADGLTPEEAALFGTLLDRVAARAREL